MHSKPKAKTTLVEVDNSKFVKWLEAAEKATLWQYPEHYTYMLQTTEHIIDETLLHDSVITIDGKPL